MPTKEHFQQFCTLVKNHEAELSFHLLEVGARPIEGESEPFYALLNEFPRSYISAFEVDPELCNQLNEKTPDNITYYPQALADSSGETLLYMTRHPMCASLYKPNAALLEKYNGLEVVQLVGTETINTMRLDAFLADNALPGADFIKIDVQGAELDIFRGGGDSIASALMIVSEVEFIELYENQPLFGDVCSYLAEQGLMFHKFLGLSGRTIKPVELKKPSAMQHMWSDAVFHSSFDSIQVMGNDGLLKLATLAFLYNSPDLSFYCLAQFDNKNQTSTHQEMVSLFS